MSQARTEGHADNKILQWDPWEGHLQVNGESLEIEEIHLHLQEGNALKKDSNVRVAPEQVKVHISDKFSLNLFNSSHHRWT